MNSSNRYHILYAEDNEDACFMLGTLLGFSDIETTSANTIDQAWQLAQAEQFNMYLLDTRFPEGSGLDLCRKLREYNNQIPIVFYSGDAREIDKANGLAAGADAYLVKPNIDTITTTILQLLNPISKSVYQTI